MIRIDARTVKVYDPRTGTSRLHDLPCARREQQQHTDQQDRLEQWQARAVDKAASTGSLSNRLARVSGNRRVSGNPWLPRVEDQIGADQIGADQ